MTASAGVYAGGSPDVEEARAGAEWPGGVAARDSTLSALASLVEAERYGEAERQARALSAAPYAAPLADSLRAVARSAEEGRSYAEARALPASELERNRDAYGDLARRFPDSPRSALYAEKRDDYAARVVDRDNARFRVAAVAPARRNCCKYCDRGKPCGDSCISRSYTCHKGPGCAC